MQGPQGPQGPQGVLPAGGSHFVCAKRVESKTVIILPFKKSTFEIGFRYTKIRPRLRVKHPADPADPAADPFFGYAITAIGKPRQNRPRHPGYGLNPLASNNAWLTGWRNERDRLPRDIGKYNRSES